MRLEKLIEDIGVVDVRGDLGTDVTGIAYDSRRVKPGGLFFTVRGFTTDGNRFIPDAIRNGAVAIMSEEQPLSVSPVHVRVHNIRKAMAKVADRFYGTPQRSLVMTGVTGTNGKTTTSYLIRSIFMAAGMSCGLIGTIRHFVGGHSVTSLNTTPEAPDIHAFLADMVKVGDAACVMEVSSHALELNRVYGIDYRAAGYLNLTRDHLDFHGDFEHYLNAKSRLFADLPGDATAVVNIDDPYAGHIMNVSRHANILTFGMGERSDIHPIELDLRPDSSVVVFATPMGELHCRLPIPGRYNLMNAMAAAGICLSCGLRSDVVMRGLETAEQGKGRYEVIDAGQDFTVIVDYAHTPDALERVLSSAAELTKGRVIAVFGCGGDRDRGKRPQMGEIATRIADFTVITSDNPRTEDPNAIIADIAAGVVPGSIHEVIPDREAAIDRAIAVAEPRDIVLIAGKGHEDYQIIGTVKHPFDDAETARRVLGTKR